MKPSKFDPNYMSTGSVVIRDQYPLTLLQAYARAVGIESKGPVGILAHNCELSRTTVSAAFNGRGVGLGAARKIEKFTGLPALQIMTASKSKIWVFKMGQRGRVRLIKEHLAPHTVMDAIFSFDLD